MHGGGKVSLVCLSLLCLTESSSYSLPFAGAETALTCITAGDMADIITAANMADIDRRTRSAAEDDQVHITGMAHSG